MKSISIDSKAIYGKSIKIFDDHSVALKAWAELANELGRPMVLLTLDKHTDVHPAFCAYGNVKAGGIADHAERWKPFANEMLSKCNPCEPDTFDSPLSYLKNDEHIAAAIDLGIIASAFVISFSDSTGTQRSPYTKKFERPEDGIFIVADECLPGCEADCARRHADHAIELDFLSNRIGQIDEMITCLRYDSIFSSPFILDIDLDYFRTEGSLRPRSPHLFHRLILSARCITIAREPSFVKHVRLDNTINADDSMRLILEQISSALAPKG